MPDVLPIQVIGNSLQSCLDDYFSDENIDWSCPQCKTTNVVRKSTIILEPKILCLQLMRYKFDEASQGILKIADNVNCSSTLSLCDGASYLLLSVINHVGEDTKSGHYNILLPTSLDDQYILIDDCDVTKVRNINQEMSKLSYIYVYEKNCK